MIIVYEFQLKNKIEDIHSIIKSEHEYKFQNKLNWFIE